MSYTLIILSIVIVVAGFLYPSNKLVTYAMHLYMWAIFAFNTANGDYISYIGIYERIGLGKTWTISHYENGYVALCMIGYRFFHFTYAQFMVMVATIATILYFIVLKLYTEFQKQNVVTSLFLIFEYWMMICQYRYYIAFLLVLLGIYYLTKINGLKGILLFCFCVAGGSLFHRSVILFLLLICLKIIPTKKCLLVVPIMSVVVLLPRLHFFSNILSRFIPKHKIAQWIYTEGKRSFIGILIVILMRVVLVYAESLIYRKSLSRVKDAGVKQMSSMILGVSAVCLSFLAMEVFVKDYERLFRIPLMLAFIMLSYYLRFETVQLRKVRLSYLVFVGYLVMYMGSFYISFDGWFVHNLVPILSYNSLLGGGGF